VCHPLLNNTCDHDLLPSDLGALAGGGGDDLEGGFVFGEGVGVDGSLWDEAVGEWEAKDAGDECCAAEEEEVPVEAAGFFQGVLFCLGG